MPTKYKWLLFDADDTLLDFKAGEAAALKSALEGMGLPTEREIIDTYSRINENLWKMLERGEMTKPRLKNLRFEQLCEHFSFAVDPIALSDSYFENLKKQSMLLPGAYDVCKALAEKYEMYIITNGTLEIQLARFGGCAIKDFFKKAYISDEIGYAKPSRGFFDAVAADIPDFDKSRALVIGDSLTSDIKGGVEYGIDTCWYDPQGKDAPEGMNITYTVKDIRDILDILE